MSVRFVIGRAGAGKTHHCLGAIREELCRAPVDGPPLVLLVPEQASLQMERALVCTGPLTAAARAQVLSFRRLALRVLQEAGAKERPALSAAARSMVLRAIVAGLAPKLIYYRRVDRLSGFFDRLGRTIGELIDEAVMPDDLRSAVSEPGLVEHRAQKLADLSLIYAAYLDYLGDERLDTSQYLQTARQALAGSEFLSGALLWVDGFAGFTRQEYMLLVELAVRCEHADITLLIDAEYHLAVVRPDDIHPADLFAKTQATHFRLHDALSERGVPLDESLLLESERAPRFANSATLTRLEAALSGADVDHGADSSGDVEIIETRDRREEVTHAVGLIGELVRAGDGALRYRDIAVIVRDLEPYHDLLSDALWERGIPYFIDRRRSAAHHPLVEFIRAANAVAAEPYSLDAIRLLLKTGLIDLAEDRADELENYLLAHGISGRELWTGKDWAFFKPRRNQKAPDPRQRGALERVNAARRCVLVAIGSFEEFARQSRTGAEWSVALKQLLEANKIAESVEAWARSADAAGDVGLADAHRQVVRDVMAFLDDMMPALSQMTLTAAEIGPVIDAGLSQLSLGLVPPTVDQVLVGSIERSRHPDLKVVILIGLNDGVFPLLGAEDAVLNDEDRSVLAGKRLRVGLTRQQRVLEETQLFYIAATRPSRKLIATYATSDTQGKTLMPSPFVAQLRDALPGIALRKLSDAGRDVRRAMLQTTRDLASALAMEMRTRPVRGMDEELVRRCWNDLYELARAHQDIATTLRPVLASLAYVNDASLSAGSVAKLIPDTCRASVSELETFAACPFKRFAEYGLRLEERQEAELAATDVGTAHHAILEEFLNDLLARQERFADVGEEDILPRLQQLAQRVGANLTAEGHVSTARDAYILARSAEDLSPVIGNQRRVAAAGRFHPRRAEAAFGYDDIDNSLPALQIDTPKGRRVLLRGFIDRIDLAEVGDELLGIVVDYKRMRDKRLKLQEVYHGISLQLLGYLLLLAERGETLAGRPIVPVGAFYVSLLQKYNNVDHPDDAPQDANANLRSKPRGVLDARRIAELDTNVPPDGRSSVFNIFRKKDGSLGHLNSIDAADPRQFQRLLTHVGAKMGELADSVLDGVVSVAPYRLANFSPCQWCDMKSVCRFEFATGTMRRLEEMNRTRVFERVEDDG